MNQSKTINKKSIINKINTKLREKEIIPIIAIPHRSNNNEIITFVIKDNITSIAKLNSLKKEVHDMNSKLLLNWNPMNNELIEISFSLQ